jgi:hypothetical protein
MNDIIITFRNKNRAKVDKLIKSLKEHYNISGGDPAQWFLGMEILRDLPLGHIWLGQEAYIEKISKLADHRRIYLTPISSDELLPTRSTLHRQKYRNTSERLVSCFLQPYPFGQTLPSLYYS